MFVYLSDRNEKKYIMTTVEIYANKDNSKKIYIIKVVKPNTKKSLFFPQTPEGKRLNSKLFVRKYDAVNLGRIYLNN
jgi:hypothetical protein